MTTGLQETKTKNMSLVHRQQPPQALIAVAQQREIAEVQSKLIIARGNPRDRILSKDRILAVCEDPDIAEEALYSYSRGGQEITGESIRLAEVMSQNWGNFECGVRELEQRDGESTVEAYAWDLETNVSDRKIFQVSHIRHTKKGSYKLSDPRDIYELVANNGARRKRACILAMIPPDVRKAAVRKCEETLKANVKITPELTQSILKKFNDDFHVSREMIEKRIQRHIDSITPAQVISLGKIYNSLKDGMSAVTDWFELQQQQPKQDGERGTLNVSDLKPKETEPDKPKDEPKGKSKQTNLPGA